MKLTLIKAGGFAGLKKTASIDVSTPSSASLSDQIRSLGENNKPLANANSRDVESYFLQIDNEPAIKINANLLTGDVKHIFDQLKAQLNY